ncbi:MAG: SUMF1/EgtB/PvdO family nonheme iron enzyme [Succinivibrio sp.]
MSAVSSHKLLKVALLTAALSAVNLSFADDLYNPNPDSDDVTVSMPCNAKMVFRKVYTSTSAQKVKDKAYNAGSSENSSPMSQNPSRRYVQGSFHDDRGYYYLIGKYELMKGQYEALVNQDKCRSTNKMSRLPAVQISYFDALNAANTYSIYLQSAKDTPANGTVKAYARLVTDDEWEYACRGGSAVTQSEFEADLPPMENDDISLYAWHQGAQSANGKLQLAGLKKPNPLGIYDMLGNAQEMTLEPFKAVRTGRLLGMSGGICVRGGSYLSPKESLKSALRTEKPLYKGNRELSANDTSTRFVLGLPVASNIDEIKKLNEQIRSLGNGEGEDGALSGEAEKLAKLDESNKKKQAELNKEKAELKKANDALEQKNSSLEDKTSELSRINNDLMSLNEKLTQSNEDLNSQLGGLKGKIELANSERESMRDNAVTANLRLGGFLCKSIKDEQSSVKYFANISKVAKEQCEKDGNKVRCGFYEKIEKMLKDHEQALQTIVTYYGDTMADASANYNPANFKSQIANSKQAFGSQTVYESFIDRYYQDLMNYQKDSKDRAANHKKWMEQCFLVR